MKLCDIIKNTEFVSVPVGMSDRNITSIVTSSKYACDETLYIELESLTRDTTADAIKAYEKGATVLSSGSCLGFPFPYIKCNNARSAYSFVCSEFYGNPCEKLKIISVTGTNGKTTFTSLLSFLLNGLGIKTGTVGTLGITSGGKRLSERFIPRGIDGMTTPDPDRLFAALEQMHIDGCEAAVCEASSHALALSKLDAFHASVSVFTNLTEDHLDFHGDMLKYYNAKCKILDISDVLLVNADDVWARKLLNKNNVFGISASGMKDDNIYSYASDVTFKGFDGVEYTAHIDGKQYGVNTSLTGEYAVFNTLAVLSALSSMGVSVEKACEILPSFRGVPGRNEIVVNVKGLPKVLIDFAHTPDAVTKTLSSLRRGMKCGKLIAVFGCGGDRDKSKRAAMGEAASVFADHSILCEDNSRSENVFDIISQIEKGFIKNNYDVICDREDAIRYAVKTAKENDVIAVLGKGDEKYIIKGGSKRLYNDRETIIKAIAEIYNINV